MPGPPPVNIHLLLVQVKEHKTKLGKYVANRLLVKKKNPSRQRIPLQKPALFHTKKYKAFVVVLKRFK